MFSRLRSAVSGAVEGLEGSRHALPHANAPHKHKYMRPSFLNLSEDAVTVSRDKKVRPVLSVSSSHPLPHTAGYSECVNAGKSIYNEDMSQVYSSALRCKVGENSELVIPYTYYAIFDGHAGFGAALDASKQLHHILNQKLVDATDAIYLATHNPPSSMIVCKRKLIVGCLETAFYEMDQVIKETRQNFSNPGGCTAIVALFILGELYIANAGDCRAGVCDLNKFIQISTDFSPYHDKERIYRKASEIPELLGEKYTVREFFETPTRDDLGRSILYKDPYMVGWSFKTLTSDDIKLPLITGIGRRSRIMGTIGVARGFGDFDLTANHYKIPIKPFLSCVPEVTIVTYEQLISENPVLVMASDGLWDAVENKDVTSICDAATDWVSVDHNKCISIAMNLVAAARGRKDDHSNTWLLKNGSTASLDDITVFVIPLEPFMPKRSQMCGTKPKIIEYLPAGSAMASETESGSTSDSRGSCGTNLDINIPSSDDNKSDPDLTP